jgi:hypothetical protein
MERLCSILSKRKRKLGSYNDSNKILCSKCNQLISIKDKADKTKTLAGHMCHCKGYDNFIFENNALIVSSNINFDAIGEDSISNISVENNDFNSDVEEENNTINIDSINSFENCDTSLYNFQVKLQTKYKQTLSSLKINRQKIMLKHQQLKIL